MNQPQLVEQYYSACPAIDRHNRCRQDDLAMERKIQVKDWDKRVNLTLLSVCIVDSWLVYKGGRGAKGFMPQHVFYEKLAEGLIDNKFGSSTFRRVTSDSSIDDGCYVPTSGIKEHLSPTKRRRTCLGALTNAVFQGRYAVCQQFKSKFLCSGCRDKANLEYFICHSQTGRCCFTKHMEAEHNQ